MASMGPSLDKVGWSCQPTIPQFGISSSSFSSKKVSIKAEKEDFFCVFTVDYQSYNKITILMKLVSKVTEIYCIADDFCKEYNSELNKTSLSLSNPSTDSPKHRKRKGRMSDAEMITILILFHSNTFRNFKHFYLFYVCRELKKEFSDLLSYTRFVERIPRVAIPLLPQFGLRNSWKSVS